MARGYAIVEKDTNKIKVETVSVDRESAELSMTLAEEETCTVRRVIVTLVPTKRRKKP